MEDIVTMIFCTESWKGHQSDRGVGRYSIRNWNKGSCDQGFKLRTNSTEKSA